LKGLGIPLGIPSVELGRRRAGAEGQGLAQLSGSGLPLVEWGAEEEATSFVATTPRKRWRGCVMPPPVGAAALTGSVVFSSGPDVDPAHKRLD
jgi:hypothetical protein